MVTGATLRGDDVTAVLHPGALIDQVRHVLPRGATTTLVTVLHCLGASGVLGQRTAAQKLAQIIAERFVVHP